MLNVYHLFWPFWLSQTAQGARLVYGAASGLATADGIRCSSCSQTWTRFQRGECFQFNYTLTAERRLKLALKGISVPEFNVKQRENEWNSCFDGILNLFFFFFLSSGLWDHITRQQTIFTGFRVTCLATSGSRASWGTLQHDLWSARAAHTVSALPTILRCGLRVQMGAL